VQCDLPRHGSATSEAADKARTTRYLIFDI
jgi:hypothetical protein